MSKECAYACDCASFVLLWVSGFALWVCGPMCRPVVVSVYVGVCKLVWCLVCMFANR